jgi:hypothetical protein
MSFFLQRNSHLLVYVHYLMIDFILIIRDLFYIYVYFLVTYSQFPRALTGKLQLEFEFKTFFFLNE